MKQGLAWGQAAVGPDPAGNWVYKGLIEQARQIVDLTPEIRPERMTAVEEALEQGNYEIDSRELANILITELILKR